ncbi:MAG TPA: BTAD domain-containing putative transcriptional regulator [Asanoa sp.]
MTVIRLLGPPAVEGDGGRLRAPRGRKAWALLGYLLLAERPPGRRHVSELLFADADDPLGALRWTLAELRRALEGAVAFAGDPIVTTLAEGVTVDLRTAVDESADPRALLDTGGELLEGVSLMSCLEFESWLLVARHRMSAVVEARMRQAAVGLLSTGRAAEAVGYAQRAVAANPLEEGNHELLVRSLAVAGDREAARRQIAVGEDLLRRELGVTASPALREAASVAGGSSMVSPLGGRAAALSQLDAGRAAIVAGAVDAGLQCLRRAVLEAERCGDPQLQARALTTLGGALVHAVRGRDEEGAVVLHEAIQLATRAGDRGIAATAHRQLGFIDVQAGRRATADVWLARAEELAEDDGELAAVLGSRGMNSSDRGDYPAAIRYLHESVERAVRAGDRRQEGWSVSVLGRAHLLRGERGQAAVALGRSLDLVRAERWVAFMPWPMAFLGEVDLQGGQVDAAADGLEQAWELACQVGDPCWEGVSGRALGLLSTVRGDHEGAWRWFGEATARSTRFSDRYQWVRGHVLDAAAAAAIARGDPDRARPIVATLAQLAARTDMRELVVRAHVHRYRMGDRAALAAARLLAADIDNPALSPLLAAH